MSRCAGALLGVAAGPAIACGYLAFGLLPLLAPALRRLPDPRPAPVAAPARPVP